jgi:predicted peptidase
MWRAMLGAVLLLFGASMDQARETGFLNRTVVVDGVAHAYQVYVPRAYERSARTPIILALHGAGERGADGLLQTEVGLGSALRRNADRYPAIVVFPQAPLNGNWQGDSARVALAALDKAEREFRTDRARTYLAGLSMGGNGSWYLAYNHPDRFAAVVVVCGFIERVRDYPPIVAADDPFAAVAQRLKRLPIWIAHGDADTVVPVEQSRRMAAALKTAGGDVRYVELPGVGHNAWDPTFRSEELPAWLFQQRR